MKLTTDSLLKENRFLLEILFRNITDLIFVMSVDVENRFRYLMVNPAAMKVAGITETAYGKTIEAVIAPERADVLNGYYREVVRTNLPLSFVEDYNGKYGETILTPVISDNGTCTNVVAITRDITAHRTYQRQLTHLANHDPLTGLPNRRYLQDSLRTFEKGMNHRNRILAVMFMDFDTFKSINDTFGHDAGDEFLVKLSKRFRSCLREADLVCRLGGDEFVAIATVADEAAAKSLGKRVIDSLGQPVTIGEGAIAGSISLGIAFFPTQGPNLDIVLKKADQALQVAKTAGGNCFVVAGNKHPSYCELGWIECK